MLAAEHINMRQLQAALSRTSETIAFTTPGNSGESQEAIADNGSGLLWC